VIDYKEIEKLGRDVQDVVGKAAADSLSELATKLIDILKRNAPDNSGFLQQTISALPLSQTPDGIKLDITWADYGTYIDEGVRGAKTTYSESTSSPFSYKSKMPPTNFSTIGGQSLAQYAESKGISPFAVAKSIFNKGLRATKWATNSLSGAELERLIDELAVEFVKSFEFKIVK